MGLFSSSKSSSVSNLTENNFNDNRQVNDAGGGIIGSRNRLDASQNWDSSNRSTNNWTQSDSGNTSITVTDAGAINKIGDLAYAQTQAAQGIAGRALQLAGESTAGAVDAAVRAQQAAISNSSSALDAALGFASSAQTKAFNASTDALGWAGQRFDSLAGITASVLQANGEATATAGEAAAGSSKAMTYVLIGAGVLLVLMVMKKG